MLSSFNRVAGSANIPLQLNFSALPETQDFIEIPKGEQMAQYVPAVLPAVGLSETSLPAELADYLVLLSEMHGGGDHRTRGASDVGASDVMRSYQLKDNPGYKQSRQIQPQKAEL